MRSIAFCSGVVVQLVEMESAFSQGFAAKSDEVVVVGEEEYLGALAQCGQLRENRRTLIVASD